MALLGKSKTLSGLFQKGIVADIAEGLGVGGIINFIDDRTGGHLKGINVSLGRTVNGQPLTLNLTDAVMVFTTTGLHLGGKNMIQFLTIAASKKFGEAFGIIMDDPLPQKTYPQLNVNRSQPAPQQSMITTAMPGQSMGVNYQ